jgi:hypothetical protein
MIEMSAEASTIVRAEAADFFRDCWAVKIPSDERVGDVSAPELYTIGPDGFENCFIEE